MLYNTFSNTNMSLYVVCIIHLCDYVGCNMIGLCTSKRQIIKNKAVAAPIRTIAFCLQDQYFFVVHSLRTNKTVCRCECTRRPRRKSSLLRSVVKDLTNPPEGTVVWKRNRKTRIKTQIPNVFNSKQTPETRD